MLVGPSIVEAANGRAAGVVLFDVNGDPIYGFDQSRPSSAVLTNVAVSTTNAVLSAADANRRGLIIYNDAAKTLRVAFAATASGTSFSVVVPSKTAYEVPLNGYNGVVAGVLDSGTGTARVTEIVS